LLQLNWGPAVKLKRGGLEKEYYLARTQLSDFIFALEKSVVDDIGLEAAIVAKVNASSTTVPTSTETTLKDEK
jgi:hypothetical protein